MKSLIYFIKPVGLTGPIKIGVSCIPLARLESLSVWSPFPLEIVATGEGNLKTEQILHSIFAEDHSHREWFQPSGKLMKLISAVRAGTPIAEAIDLKDTGRRIRECTRKPIPPARRRFLSYSHRIRHALARASVARGVDHLHPPHEVVNIMERWQGQSYFFVPGVEPTEDEIARVENFLEHALDQAITFAQRWPRNAANDAVAA